MLTCWIVRSSYWDHSLVRSLTGSNFTGRVIDNCHVSTVHRTTRVPEGLVIKDLSSFPSLRHHSSNSCIQCSPSPIYAYAAQLYTSIYLPHPTTLHLNLLGKRYWLPVEQRVQHKIALMTYKVRLHQGNTSTTVSQLDNCGMSTMGYWQ